MWIFGNFLFTFFSCHHLIVKVNFLTTCLLSSLQSLSSWPRKLFVLEVVLLPLPRMISAIKQFNLWRGLLLWRWGYRIIENYWAFFFWRSFLSFRSYRPTWFSISEVGPFSWIIVHSRVNLSFYWHRSRFLSDYPRFLISKTVLVVWRILFGINRLNQSKNMNIWSSELALMYDHSTFGSSRFLLRVRTSKPHLILNSKQNDDDWKTKYFFVRHDSIPEGDSFPKTWIK